MRQEVPDRVHAAEARPPDSREGGGPVVPPLWDQGVHPRFHEPTSATQAPRGEFGQSCWETMRVLCFTPQAGYCYFFVKVNLIKYNS